MNQITSKEKIIIGVLSIIFILVLGGMIWDLYGRKIVQPSTTQPTQISGIPTPNPTGTTGNQVNTKKQTNKQSTSKPEKKTDTTVAYSSYSTCIENTKDEAASKDCCDCLTGDASLHKACRDYAATYDFSKNTVFKTFTITSTLGRNGDYSKCTASGNQQQCKECCEQVPNIFSCGDFQYCRTACNNIAQ